LPLSEQKGVRLAQNVQVGPCIPVAIQLEQAGVGPTSGPTRRLSHLAERRLEVGVVGLRREVDDGVCVDEGARLFVTAIRSSYRDYPHKREWGGRMTEGPRLSRPWIEVLRQ
jgi:hypothetical protein